MDEITRKKLDLVDLFNSKLNKAPINIKNKLFPFIDRCTTIGDIKSLRDTIESIVIDENVYDLNKWLIDIVSREIPVDHMLAEVNSMPDNWFIDQTRQKNIIYQKDTEAIHLVKGVSLFLGKPFERSYNSHVYRKTKEYSSYPNITTWLDNFALENNCKISRVAIVKLKVGGTVTSHVDYGDYYKMRNRYHLCLDGEYRYNVLDHTEIIKKGTLFKFNNKCFHEAINIGTVPRICVIFDTEDPARTKSLQIPA